MSGYGIITEEMDAVLTQHVRGRRVLYPGSGWGEKARRLIELGASHVTCIEKMQVTAHDPMITQIHGYLENLSPVVYHGQDVLFLSWVVPYGFCRHEHIYKGFDKIPTILYLGKNTDGTVCGDAQLFDYLLTREVLGEVTHRANTLIVYGRKLSMPRTLLLPEESAALNSWGPEGAITYYQEEFF